MRREKRGPVSLGISFKNVGCEETEKDMTRGGHEIEERFLYRKES